MAQEVGWGQNNVEFKEGPFVIVNINGWRIEAELKGHYCPVLPASSIYRITERMGFSGKTDNKEQAEMVCDALNGMVRTGQIVLADNGWWVDAREVELAKKRAEQILQEIN